MNFNEEQEPAFPRFEDLRMDHKSLDYALWITGKVKNLPAAAFDSIGKHLIDAAMTIPVYMEQDLAGLKANISGI